MQNADLFQSSESWCERMYYMSIVSNLHLSLNHPQHRSHILAPSQTRSRRSWATFRLIAVMQLSSYVANVDLMDHRASEQRSCDSIIHRCSVEKSTVLTGPDTMNYDLHSVTNADLSQSSEIMMLSTHDVSNADLSSIIWDHDAMMWRMLTCLNHLRSRCYQHTMWQMLTCLTHLRSWWTINVRCDECWPVSTHLRSRWTINIRCVECWPVSIIWDHDELSPYDVSNADLSQSSEIMMNYQHYDVTNADLSHSSEIMMNYQRTMFRMLTCLTHLRSWCYQHNTMFRTLNYLNHPRSRWTINVYDDVGFCFMNRCKHSQTELQCLVQQWCPVNGNARYVQRKGGKLPMVLLNALTPSLYRPPFPRTIVKISKQIQTDHLWFSHKSSTGWRSDGVTVRDQDRVDAVWDGLMLLTLYD